VSASDEHGGEVRKLADELSALVARFSVTA
jgi:hypothetical protein